MAAREAFPASLFEFGIASKEAALWPLALYRNSAEEVADYFHVPDGTLDDFYQLLMRQRIELASEHLGKVKIIRSVGFDKVVKRIQNDPTAYGGAAGPKATWDVADHCAHAVALAYRGAVANPNSVGPHFEVSDGKGGTTLEHPECLFKVWTLLRFMRRSTWGRSDTKPSRKTLKRRTSAFVYPSQPQYDPEDDEDGEGDTAPTKDTFVIEGPSITPEARVIVTWKARPEGAMFKSCEFSGEEIAMKSHSTFMADIAVGMGLKEFGHCIHSVTRTVEDGFIDELGPRDWSTWQKAVVDSQSIVEIDLHTEEFDFDIDSVAEYHEMFQEGRTAADKEKQQRAMALLVKKGLDEPKSKEVLDRLKGPLPADQPPLPDEPLVLAEEPPNPLDEDLDDDPEEPSARRGRKGAADFLRLFRVGFGPHNFQSVPREQDHRALAKAYTDQPKLRKTQGHYLKVLGEKPVTTRVLDKDALAKLDKNRRDADAYEADGESPLDRDTLKKNQERDAVFAAMVERANNSNSQLFEGCTLQQAHEHLALPFNQPRGEPAPLLPNQKSDSFRLRPSQITGLSFVMDHIERAEPGCMIGDEIGTGKTLIYAAVVSEQIRRRLKSGRYCPPTLMVVPGAILSKVARDLLSFGLNLRILNVGDAGHEVDDLREFRVKTSRMAASTERSDRFADEEIQADFDYTAKGTATVYLTTPGIVSRRFAYRPDQPEGEKDHDDMFEAEAFHKAELRRARHIQRLQQGRREDGAAEIYRDEDDDISISDFFEDIDSSDDDDGELDNAFDFADPVKPRKESKHYRVWPRFKKWGMFVFDEAHILRSAEGRLWQALIKLLPCFKLLVTATPMFNRSDNFAAYLRLWWNKERVSPPFLDPADLATAAEEDFNPYLRNHDDTQLSLFRRSPYHFRKLLRREYADFGEVATFEAMRLLLADVQLRRTMETRIQLADGSAHHSNFQHVGAGIPEYIVKQVKLRFNPKERQEYNLHHTTIYASLFVRAKSLSAQGRGDDVIMDAGLARLLYLMCSSLLLARLMAWLDGPDELQKDEKVQYDNWYTNPKTQRKMGLRWMATRTTYSDEPMRNRQKNNVEFMRSMTHGSPKLRYLCYLILKHCLLADEQKEHHQITVFVEYPDTQKFLLMFFTELWFKVEALHAQLDYSQRDRIIARFNEGGQIDILICEYSMSGVGIDLQAQCSVVVNFEPARSASAESQAWGRIRRLGQRCRQLIYRLFVEGTFDEWIEQKQWEKYQDAVMSWGSDSLVAVQRHVEESIEKGVAVTNLEGDGVTEFGDNLFKQMVRRLTSVHMGHTLTAAGDTPMKTKLVKAKEKKANRKDGEDE